MQPSRAHLVGLLNAVRHIVWSTTADGRLEFGNSGWARLIGSCPGADVEAALARKIHTNDRARRSEQWRTARGSGRPYEVEYRLESSDGTGAHWYLERGTPLHNGVRDAFVGWAATATPIDASKGVEKELRSAVGCRDDFFAVLLHELRNPLASIANALGVLERDAGNMATVLNAHGIIQRQFRQLARLVDDLLDTSRITRGILELRKCTVDLQEVLNVAIESAKPLIELRHQEFTVSSRLSRLPVVADPVRIAQVLTNLLVNAAKFSPPGGHIAVFLEQEAAMARLRVRDDGIGIPPERLSDVFQLFRRGDPDRAAGSGGLGVGLALARQLMELHGGTIEARSEGAGRGSEFAIRLPRAL